MKTFYGQIIPAELDTPKNTLGRAAYHLIIKAGGQANLNSSDYQAVVILNQLRDSIHVHLSGGDCDCYYSASVS